MIAQMTDEAGTDSEPSPEIALAIAYAPRGARAGLMTLFALDAQLGAIVRRAREPLRDCARLRRVRSTRRPMTAALTRSGQGSVSPKWIAVSVSVKLASRGYLWRPWKEDVRAHLVSPERIAASRQHVLLQRRNA